MALSNWDTFGIRFVIEERIVGREESGMAIKDTKVSCEPCDGTFIARDGTRYEVYKNWVSILNQEMWIPGGPYTEPVIGQVTEGVMQLGRGYLTAWRGPKNGVYVVVRDTEYRRSDDEPTITRGMVAAGVSGYAEYAMPRTWKMFGLFVCPEGDCTEHSDEEGQCPTHDVPLRWDQFEPSNNDEYPYLGFQQEDLDWFRARVELAISTNDLEAPLAKIDWSAAARFNQGDAFFADQGIPIKPHTAVGEAGPTLMSKVTDEWRRKPEMIPENLIAEYGETLRAILELPETEA